ncbi:MAG: amino acid ABC transporter permease [Comamonadaceae bacterium]|nr:MAG: amino acid ABC transporter permease [Comamonadaceae bacterium]
MNAAITPGVPPPATTSHWREELFGGPVRSIVTLLLVAFAGWLLFKVVDWGVVRAVFRPDAEACRASDQVGACWGVVTEKIRPLLFGRYPYALQWRPGLSVLLVLALLALSAWPRSWRPGLVAVWAAGLALFGMLMRGGVFGLDVVPTNLWGGLPLTLILSIAGLALAFPPAVLLALGRRSSWPVIRTLCATYVELIRGVPLISVLFMASFLLPLLVPVGLQPDVLFRVLAGISLFAAAYLAEIIRGGLQAVPKGQVDAAVALGLKRWQVQREIVLPQALRMVVPSLMNSVIGTLKDSSLVTVVGLYELTGALSLALGGDPVWRPFYLEGYFFIAAVYWVMCFGLSRYGRWIERRLSRKPD